MAFSLVVFKDDFHFCRHGRIDFHQPLGDVLVNCGLAYPKYFCGGTNGGIGLKI